MPGILWSQQEQLAGAVNALKEWQVNASAVGVLVTQLNLTLLDPSGDSTRNARVVFEWNEAAQEYAMRTE